MCPDSGGDEDAVEALAELLIEFSRYQPNGEREHGRWAREAAAKYVSGFLPPGQRERGEDDAYEAPSGRSGGCAPSTDVDGFLCGGLFHCDRPEYHAGPHASAVPVGEGADSGPDHQAYADPIDGGWGGYEAACHDCAWRGGVVHDDKGLAQEEAWEHAEQAPPPSPSGAGQPQLHPEAGQRARRILELDASDRDHADAAREIYVEAVYLAQYVLRALSAPRETRGRGHD
jgi:hypothetical protein